MCVQVKEQCLAAANLQKETSLKVKVCSDEDPCWLYLIQLIEKIDQDEQRKTIEDIEQGEKNKRDPAADERAGQFPLQQPSTPHHRPRPHPLVSQKSDEWPCSYKSPCHPLTASDS